MIHHLSVAARDPAAVAAFFAEIMGGTVAPFPPNPGSYMAFAADDLGTAVEVYPAGTVMRAGGEQGAGFGRLAGTSGETATHFALGVELAPEAAAGAAAKRGWKSYVCSRGGEFRVLEVWIENAWLVELLPPAFASEYLGFARRFTQGADAASLMAKHAPKPVAAPALQPA